MSVGPDKKELLEERMKSLGIYEADVDEKFVLGSGSGGQKINKTASCVYLKHIPTGIEVKCQKGRSREMNRYYARRLLCDKIETIQKGAESAKAKEVAKLRKQKKRRTRRVQAKLIEDKRQLSDKKTMRKPPKSQDD